MEIMKVKNYIQFAEMLKKKTGYDVVIKVVEKNHYHYQFNYDGLSLGVLCINQGDVSFAPFVTEQNAKNDMFINVQYMPLFDEFAKLLGIFKEMFVTEFEE